MSGDKRKKKRPSRNSIAPKAKEQTDDQYLVQNFVVLVLKTLGGFLPTNINTTDYTLTVEHPTPLMPNGRIELRQLDNDERGIYDNTSTVSQVELARALRDFIRQNGAGAEPPKKRHKK
ncbi:MAG: hypothetical protein GY928_33430 [Colwellia sp.]|nr:hypothetical protein [Colwellia sp.]